MGHRVQPDTIVELLRPIIFLALISSGCTGPAPSSGQATGPPDAAQADSLVVDSAEVIFFSQDSLRLASSKAVLAERQFKSLMHDCAFETKYARSVIQRDRPALPVVDISANRWLVFRKKDGGRKTIDLNTIKDLCGVFLFDGVKDPIRADMPNIASQLWFYFGEVRR